MKIKTVWNIVENASFFDAEVNGLLEDGWQISRREFIPGENYGGNADRYGKRLLYAELVKLDEADMEPREPDPPFGWDEAVETIREECKAAAGCDERCPVYAWCQENIPIAAPAPKRWTDPK